MTTEKLEKLKEKFRELTKAQLTQVCVKLAKQVIKLEKLLEKQKERK